MYFYLASIWNIDYEFQSGNFFKFVFLIKLDQSCWQIDFNFIVAPIVGEGANQSRYFLILLFYCILQKRTRHLDFEK